MFYNFFSLFYYNDPTDSKIKERIGAIRNSLDLIEFQTNLDGNEELIKYVILCIRELYTIIYRYNSTVQNDFELPRLKENIQNALILCGYLQDILNYVSVHFENSILEIEAIFEQLPDCIYLTFEHCKNSQQIYQRFVHNCKDIVTLYKNMQELYLKYLHFLPSLTFRDESKQFSTVLESVLRITDVSFGMNLKSLAENWKGYSNIVDKRLEKLVDEKYYGTSGIRILMVHITNLMESALIENGDKQICLQNIKLSSLLLKIAFKILKAFWEYYLNFHLEIFWNFIVTIYSFSLDYVILKQCPSSLTLVETDLLSVLENFVSSVLECNFISQLFKRFENFGKNSYNYYGSLLLNLRILKYLNEKENTEFSNLPFYLILRQIFIDVKSCYLQFFWNPSKNSTFILLDDLVLYISSNLILNTNFYSRETEEILIENILDESVWCHLLASRIWIFLLSKASRKNSGKIVEMFLDNFEKLNYSSFVETQQKVHLIVFVRNICEMFMDEKDYINRRNLWTILGCEYFSIVQKKSMFSPTLNKVERVTEQKFGCNNLPYQEFLELIDRLELLSIVNRTLKDSEATELTFAVSKMWNLDMTCFNMDNNFTKHFFRKMIKISSNLINRFDNGNLVVILKCLNIVVEHKSYKVFISEFVKALSRRVFPFSKEQNTLYSLTSDLFVKLLSDPNQFIVELSLDSFHAFAKNEQNVVVNNVKRMVGNPKTIDEYYRTPMSSDLELNTFLKSVQNFKFEHKCLKETVNFNRHNSNKSINEHNGSDNQMETKRIQFKPYKKSCPSIQEESRHSSVKRLRTEEVNEEVSEESDVKEILDRIKGEIKCLHKVLLKEKITPKNAHGIKMLVSQLEASLSIK